MHWQSFGQAYPTSWNMGWPCIGQPVACTYLNKQRYYLLTFLITWNYEINLISIYLQHFQACIGLDLIVCIFWDCLVLWCHKQTFSIIFNLEGLGRHSRIFHAIKKWTIGPVTATISLYVIYFRKIRNEFLKYFTLRRACISRETGWRLATSFKVHGNHAGLAHRMIQLLAAVSTGVWACKP